MDVAKYYAMCEWFDETCGSLIDCLEEREIRDDTVILYICDNGWGAPSTRKDDPTQKLWKGYAQRSKSTPFENGIRTPIMVSWPDKVTAGKSADLAHAIDLYPTIAAVAGMDLPDGLTGVDLLDDKARGARSEVFGVTHSVHNMTPGDPADTLQYRWCVEKRWKLMIRHHGKDTTNYRNLHIWDKEPIRLYDLQADPHEKENLAGKHPDIVEKLRAKIDAWWTP